MDEDALRALKRAHQFDRWRDRTTLGENLFVRDFFIEEGVLEGWRLVRATPLRVPGMPPYTQSLWSPRDGSSEALLRLDVYECDSRHDAHELLVRLVGQFQAPGTARRDDQDVGDVNFVSAGDGGVVFSRGNLVFFVARAGPAQVPVLEVARRLDRELRSKPGDERLAIRGAAPRRGRARLAGTEKRDRWNLELPREREPRGERRAYRKIFSAGGEVHAEGDQLVYEATQPGPPQVEVFTVDSEGVTDREIAEPPES